VKYLVIGVIMCMIMHVARKIPTPEPTGTPYLRRRVIVELTPQELPLLEEAERRHGTKRQAIVSALEAASQSAELERELAGAQAEAVQLEEELKTLRKDRAVGEKVSERLTRELKKVRGELASARDSAGSSSRKSEQRLEGLERLLSEREREIRKLEEQIFDKLFCGRCRTWVSPSEFGWTQREDGAYAYHLACGDHGSEVMKPSSRLGWQSDS
jgi:myosin heavy subunit